MAMIVLAVYGKDFELSALYWTIALSLIALSAVGMILWFLKRRKAKSVPASLSGAWKSEVAYGNAQPRAQWLTLCLAIVVLGIAVWCVIAGKSIDTVLTLCVLGCAAILAKTPYFAYGRRQISMSKSGKTV